MKRLQRLAVHHEGDGHKLGTADALEMVLDIADDKGDLVEVVEMIDHLQFLFGRDFGGSAPRVATKVAPRAESAPHKMLRRCMTLSLYAERRWRARDESIAFA